MTPLLRRVPGRWLLPVLATGLVLLATGGCGEGSPSGSSDRAATLGAAPQDTPSATATPDPVKAAKAEAKQLAQRGKYAAASAALSDVGLRDESDRIERRGARVLLRSARSALAKGRYSRAKRLASQSRQLRKTAAARTVLTSANTAIAQAKVVRRERRRLARIARDQRTCSSAEKRTVRDSAGTPAGCAAYAAEYAAKQAAKAQDDEGGGGDCDPNYSGACLKPDSSDYDCSGGSGDGPDYTGPVQVVGDDPYDLDRDGDGFACETS